MAETEQSDVAALTVQLLSAYLANNTVAHTDIAELVRTTRAALIEETKPASVEPEMPVYTPAVSVRRSLASPDQLISLIDGKPYKTLKRHLSRNGLTPDGYRARYNLPASYPMVAPGFAEQRRAIAKKIGLGSRAAALPAAPDENSKPIQESASSEKSAADAVVKKPRTPRVAKALAPSKTSVEEVKSLSASTATPEAPSKPSTPKPAARKPAEAKSAAAKKPVVKVDKASKSDGASAVDSKAEVATPEASVPAKSVAMAIPAAKSADEPVKKQASTRAKVAPSAPAKAKPARDKLSLFRDVAEATAARDLKKTRGKNESTAKAAKPASVDDTASDPTVTEGSTASDV